MKNQKNMAFKLNKKHFICVFSIIIVLLINYKITEKCINTKNMAKEIHVFVNNKLLTTNELIPTINLYTDIINESRVNSTFRLHQNVTDKDLRYFVEEPVYRFIRVGEYILLIFFLSGAFIEVFDILEYID